MSLCVAEVGEHTASLSSSLGPAIHNPYSTAQTTSLGRGLLLTSGRMSTESICSFLTFHFDAPL